MLKGKSDAPKGTKLISSEEIKREAERSGLSEEEVLFGKMRRNPVVYGALSDWEEIQPISLAVMKELKPYRSHQELYDLVLRIIWIYDTYVISVLRSYTDVRRLALFVNEMIERMLDVQEYEAALCAEYGLCLSDRMELRGIVLRRIARDDVLWIFRTNGCGYFRAEIFCSAKYFADIPEGVVLNGAAANESAAAISK